MSDGKHPLETLLRLNDRVYARYARRSEQNKAALDQLMNDAERDANTNPEEK